MKEHGALPTFAQALERYEPVLGFEVHVELNTATKMFSAAPNSFGGVPNSQVTEVDLGLPGVLPVVNRAAVESSIAIGLALGCQIAKFCRFARKNYFYPDTPKNFQTSQYDEPIAHDGSVEVELSDGTVFIVDVERAHMEEDAGKMTHLGSTGRIQSAEASLIDYNRAGVPLVEIVTRPILGSGHHAPELARYYVANIREIMKTLGVSDARMERGNIRCDANVSLMPRGATQLGTRTEVKNINSLRAVESAVSYEIRRHAALLNAGQSVLQETRHWHEESKSTTAGRPKSDAEDYRYFPEPDLMPLTIDARWVEQVRASMPELPLVRRKRLFAAWDYTALEFRDVVNAGLLDAIEATVATGLTPADARKWWMGEMTRRAKERGVEATALGVEPQTLRELQSLVDEGTINDKLAREVLDAVLAHEGTPREIVQQRGLAVLSDDSALLAVIREVVAQHPEIVEKIRQGKTQAAGALVGSVMQATRGQADAARVRELLDSVLTL